MVGMAEEKTEVIGKWGQETKESVKDLGKRGWNNEKTNTQKHKGLNSFQVMREARDRKGWRYKKLSDK